MKYAYVGCFTTEKREARGQGVAVYRIDANGKWSRTERPSGRNHTLVIPDR